MPVFRKVYMAFPDPGISVTNKVKDLWAEELADRKRQGLTGDAAVKHYNDWMDRHGMSHLKVPYLT